MFEGVTRVIFGTEKYSRDRSHILNYNGLLHGVPIHNREYGNLADTSTRTFYRLSKKISGIGSLVRAERVSRLGPNSHRDIGGDFKIHKSRERVEHP